MDRDFQDIEIEHCSACNAAMNVSALAPFTQVECPECGEPVRVKTELGSYKILQRQGVGGMSHVFAGMDKTLGRKVAIKLLNEDYSLDAKRVAEFEKEAKITASISHQNVVRVYTVGQSFGRYFIAMELVEGDSLEQRMLKKGRLSEKFLVQLAIDIVEGLKAAHEAGLIHRDMKPGNVLIDAEGRAKIVDFGLALMTSDGTAIADEIWATPYYAPPETLRMEEEDLRSDIYALGASLYHAISGGPPFVTDTRSTSELQKIKQAIPQLSDAANGVSLYFCNLVDKAMAFDAEDRFQDYDALLYDLKQIELFHRIGKRPEERECVVKQSGGSKKPLPWLVIAAAVLVLGLLGGVVWVGTQSEEIVETTVVEKPTQEPEQQKDPDPAVDDQATRVVITTELRNAQNLFYASQYADAHAAYLALALHENVECDTAFWAGLRAVIVAFLEGEPQKGRSTIEQVLAKWKEIEGETTPVSERLRTAMLRLMEPGVIEIEASQLTGSSVDAMVVAASSLKEWEQGDWQAAITLMKQLDEMRVEGDQRERQFLQKELMKYREDYLLLEPFYKGVNPQTIEKVKETQDRLITARRHVQSGRKALQNVQLWQRQLVVKLIALEEAQFQAEKEQEVARITLKNRWNRHSRKAKKALQLHQFVSVVEILEPSEPIHVESKKWREDTLYMCQRVQGLFQILVQSLKGKKVAAFTVRRLDGEKEYEGLLGLSEEGLLVKEKKGGKKVLRWGEVSPYTLLELSRKLSTSEWGEEEKFKYKEGLVYYCWLTGLDVKAKAGAKILSEQSEDFAQRWPELMRVME